MTTAGLSRSLVHKLLAALVECGAVVKLRNGHYGAVRGVNVAGALERYYAEREPAC
jgi:DNA-binding IclR family transcriptional regulator